MTDLAKNLARVFLGRLIRRSRSIKYSLLSQNRRTVGRPTKVQPLLLMGRGEIVFERNVTFGVSRAPGFYSSYGYVESRESTAKIVFGENTHLNNGCSVVAESCAIRIGSGCLVGDNVVIYDSDFHPLDPIMRHQSRGHVGDVLIGDNVFVGSNAIILKNSSIGPGSVIAAGAVVSGRFPENSLIAGNPATVIRKL